MLTARVSQRTSAALALVAIGAVLSSGCNQGLRRVPATGIVTLDGKPLEGGILHFNPDVSKGNTAPVNCSSIVKNGEYELRTAAIDRSESGLGIPPGWYKVYVRVNIKGEKVQRFPGPPVTISRAFLKPETTPLAIEIVDEPAPGAYDLMLTSK